jgi:hypothetical protein
VRARTRKGPIGGDVVLAGVEGDSAPLDAARIERSDPVIGIFTPKAITWQTLQSIIDDCRTVFRARQIVIRWHPSRLDQARYLHARHGSDIEESRMSATLAEIARRCDWVIADENSNVHLPVLKLGIPTVVINGLGLYPESRSDMYGFAGRGHRVPAGPLAARDPGARLQSVLRRGMGSPLSRVRRVVSPFGGADRVRGGDGRAARDRRTTGEAARVTRRVGTILSLLVSGALLFTLYRSLDVRLVWQALLRTNKFWLVISVGMIVPIPTCARSASTWWRRAAPSRTRGKRSG